MKTKLLDRLNEYPQGHRLIEHRYDLYLFQHENSDWLTHKCDSETAPVDTELCFDGICVKMSATVQDAILAFSKGKE